MRRKKGESEEIELVPEETFEEAMQAVLRADKNRVGDQLEKLQSSNRAKREDRQRNAKPD